MCAIIKYMEDNKETVASSVEDAKKLFTKEHPHPTRAYWVPELNKWKGYKSTKGLKPPWDPYNPARKKTRVTMNERKFLMVYSQTGKKAEAFKAVYKYTQYPDKRIEDARVRALAEQVLTRIKNKAPELVAAFTFEDMTPDFIRKEYMKLYTHDHATIAEKRAILADMAKINAMFTEKIVTDQKIREVVNPMYSESDEDFPDRIDKRQNRLDIEQDKVGI